MKKIYLILSVVMCVSVKVDAQNKLDLETQRVVDSSKGIDFIVDDRTTRQNVKQSSSEIPVIIEITDENAVAEIERFGIEIINRIGNMVMVNVNAETVEYLESINSVKAISSSKLTKRLMDEARKASYVDDVHQATGLETSYTGKGVIVSLFDQGLDPNHVNFMKSDMSETRVKNIWEYDRTGEIGTYSSPDDIRTFSTDTDSDTHGTHVLGIITGSYTGETEYATKGLMRPSVKTGSNPYYGIATDADIAIGCGQLYTSNILAGIQRIEEYAAQENKPAVINLSLGLLDGAQDGTDPTAKYLAELGKNAIIVIASGNDGDQAYTVSKTLSENDTQVKTFVDLDNSRQTGTVNIWGSDSRIFTVKIAVVSKRTGEVKGYFTLDHSTYYETEFYTTSNYTSPEYQHNDQFDKAFTSSNIQAASNIATYNNRYNVALNYTLTPNSTTNSDGDLTFGIIVEGYPGQRIDIQTTTVTDSGYGYLVSHNLNGWEDGSGVMSVSGMACGDNVIVVGSYNTRVSWATLNKDSYSYTQQSGITTIGDVSPFTSYGITVNGKSLPDVCAPGAGIISSFSSYYVSNAIRSGAMSSEKELQGDAQYNSQHYYWGISQGTSMACPSVTGIIALWLEADPSLKVDDVKRIIKETAVRDKYVDENVQWGAGKIDALAGIKKVLDDKASVGAIFADDARNFIVTPVDGGYNVYVGGEREVAVTVYDMSGRAVAQVAADDNTADVATGHLSKGVYILTAQGNTQRHSTKIVVK